MEFNAENPRGITYRTYPNFFGVGDLLTRKDVADIVGKSYTTVMYHLERAVSDGLLHKVNGLTYRNQPGWLYALPETMPRIEDM